MNRHVDAQPAQGTRFNRTGAQLWATYLNILNVYGRENSNGYEWDERRGVNIIQGLGEALPAIGPRTEYSWTSGDCAAH